MLNALVTLLFGSLPTSRQQLVEKAVASGEIAIDSLDSAYPENRLKVVESIIEVVAKDSTTDAIERLTTLNQSANTCVRKNTETIRAFIEIFSIPAQAYLNYTSTDKSSAASQNHAMTLVSNANLSQELFSTVMLNLVSSRKNATNENHPTISIDVTRIKNLISAIASLVGGESSESLQKEIDEFLTSMKTAKRHFKERSLKTFHGCLTILADAISALEEISLNKNEISRKRFEDNEKSVAALMTQSALARRFDNRNRRYNSQKNRTKAAQQQIISPKVRQP